MEKLAYLLGPVRKVTDKERQEILRYRNQLLRRGFEVFDPLRDAPQESLTGYEIVVAELKWLRRMGRLEAFGGEAEVAVFWKGTNPPSEGSMVDVGLVLGLGLKQRLVCEWGNEWGEFLGQATRIRDRHRFWLERSRSNSHAVEWRVWSDEHPVRDLEYDRVKLGLIISTLSRVGGRRITALNLTGEDDPDKKSYPKVINEIIRRQQAGIPLW